MSSPEDEHELIASLRKVRDVAREGPEPRPALPSRPGATPAAPALSKLVTEASAPDGTGESSPDRSELNALWNIADASITSQGFLSKLFSPLRRVLSRLARFTLGPVVERQVRMNSAQVRFDNEMVSYLDGRLDRMGEHYDRVLGLHGKRMEEIDERHLILQQELIRHVHDLVERIEFVFETAETNHLQLDSTLRETREELREIVARIEALGAPSGNER